MRKRAGFTFVEIVIASVVLLVLLAATTGITGTAGSALAAGKSIAALESEVNRVLDRIGEELIQAGEGTLTPAIPDGSPELVYRRGTGYAAGEPVWGAPCRIELRPDEEVDGIDNDGDGLVDEMRVVWVRGAGLPAEQVVKWAGDVPALLAGETLNGEDDNGNGLVDEPGLCFELRGKTLTVWLTLQGRDPDGNPLVRTASTAIRLRN